MPSPLQDSLRTNSFSVSGRTAPATQPDDASSRPEQYRLLVSRAVTQRLHSPSLVDTASSTANTLEEWEKKDRWVAQVNVEAHARRLGVPWEQFLQDVERASNEVYFLMPTRCIPPKTSMAANQKVKAENGLHVYGTECEAGEVEVGHERWKRREEDHIDALRKFSRARLGCPAD